MVLKHLHNIASCLEQSWPPSRSTKKYNLEEESPRTAEAVYQPTTSPCGIEQLQGWVLPDRTAGTNRCKSEELGNFNYKSNSYVVIILKQNI